MHRFQAMDSTVKGIIIALTPPVNLERHCDDAFEAAARSLGVFYGFVSEAGMVFYLVTAFNTTHYRGIGLTKES